MAMKIAMLAPIAWRTPPRHYGPWESVVSLLSEGLVSRGISVTLFATADSVTTAELAAVCSRGYEEDKSIDAGVWESLHVSEIFERAGEFDLIHNHFDFRPLTYSKLVATPVLTTIHGFSSPRILPVYRKYNDNTFYVSISDADQSNELSYLRTIHHGIDLSQFHFNDSPEDYLLFFGRIHRDKGAAEAIQIARAANKRLIIAGIVQDEEYFRSEIEPHIDSERVDYIGSVGPDERNCVLGNAQALLHPIHFDEPFGLSVVESMACGTPVIAFSRGSMPEVIANGKTGYLVSATVAAAAEKVALLDKIDRRQCRIHVESQFTVQRMVADYIDVYDEILSAEARKS